MQTTNFKITFSSCFEVGQCQPEHQLSCFDAISGFPQFLQVDMWIATISFQIHFSSSFTYHPVTRRYVFPTLKASLFGTTLNFNFNQMLKLNVVPNDDTQLQPNVEVECGAK
jgi:hypothetical protein